MKITDNFPFLTIDYPTKKASVVIITVFGMPCILAGFFVLFLVLQAAAPITSVPGIAGTVFTLVGLLIIMFGIKLALQPDRLIIDFRTETITRIFGSGSIYNQYTQTNNEYSLDSLEELFIDRNVAFMLRTTDNPSPIYHLICGFNDSQGNKVVLHAGNLNTVKKTVEILAKKLEKDILDLTAIEDRIIPFINTELLEEIRFPTTKFIRSILFGFSVAIGLFLLGILLPFFSGTFTGFEDLFLDIAGYCILGSLIILISLVIWFILSIPREMKCQHCGTRFTIKESTCSHCGEILPIEFRVKFGPFGYKYKPKRK